MIAQKEESNFCSFHCLQVWSLQPGPPNVIWTRDPGSKLGASFRKTLTPNIVPALLDPLSSRKAPVYRHASLIGLIVLSHFVWNIQCRRRCTEYTCTESAAGSAAVATLDTPDRIKFEYRPGSRELSLSPETHPRPRDVFIATLGVVESRKDQVCDLFAPARGPTPLLFQAGIMTQHSRPSQLDNM